MAFEIQTDKEIEELKKRAIRAAEFLRRKSATIRSRGAIPADGEASSVAVCALQDARVMLGGRCILERCERDGWLRPVRRGKRLTLFKRDDLEGAQLRISWGELP